MLCLSSFHSGDFAAESSEMSLYCLWWFGCMAVHRQKTVGIKVGKCRVIKTVWSPAAPETALLRTW